MIDAMIDAGREAARSGRWDDALRQYERAFAHLTREGTAAQAAEIARLTGVVHHQRGDLELAREAYDLSLCIAEASGSAAELASALICVALGEQHCGRLEAAERLYGRAQEIADENGDEALAALVELNLGIVANIRGDLEGALRRHRSSLERHRRLGDEVNTLRSLHNTGMAHVDLAEWGPAADCFDAAHALAERLQDADMLGTIEINRAELHLRSGRYDRARDSCDRAFEIFGRLHSDSGLAEVYKFYGLLYRETAKPVLAEAQFASAIELARRSDDRLLEAEALSEWALAHLAEERNAEALRCLNEAHRIFSGLHARRELLDLDRRLDGLEATYLRVVRAWGESIESKDRYTAGHCERVADYACLLAEAVGIGGRDLTWLRMGGFLHDVGKIAVPAEVLNKPGKLDPDEWALMKSHAARGDEIVAELNFPWDIRPLVRSHHERWDGSGYPDGLAGEEIPLTARILCVADVFDALTTTRSYRPALSRDEALRIMERDSGRIFDPHLFPLFREVIGRGTSDHGQIETISMAVAAA